MSRIQLIVGLGNPGPEYQATRHNAGAWLVERLASDLSVRFENGKKFNGQIGKGQYQGDVLHFLLPETFMNLSGQSVAAYAGFFKIPVAAILIVHDELDLMAGVARFKQGGGAGGHNGVRNVIACLGSDAFNRLRVGIGHPGGKEKVLGHVLKKADVDDQQLIDDSIDQALAALPKALLGNFQDAMTELHSQRRNSGD